MEINFKNEDWNKVDEGYEIRIQKEAPGTMNSVTAFQKMPDGSFTDLTIAYRNLNDEIVIECNIPFEGAVLIK